jgi:hypothetical protein
MSDADTMEPDNWSDDVLARSIDAAFLEAFLLGRVAERHSKGVAGSYVLNLNAAWGQGKTFFLDRFERDLKATGYLVAKVNAWRDDYAEDPLLSVMASIDDVVQNDRGIAAKTKGLGKKLGIISGQVVASAAKGFIKQAANRYIGGEAVEIIASVTRGIDNGNGETIKEVSKAFDQIWDEQANSLLAKFKNSRKTQDQFKASLRAFVEALRKEQKAPLFILIDEMDRCRPTYAVTLLERVKHLFDLDGIVFLIATDTDQLQHAVSAVYGTAFDSKKYLGRFFDGSYTFENESYKLFVADLARARPLEKERVSLPPGTNADQFISEGIDYYGLTLRDAQRVYDVLANVVTAWNQNCPLELLVLTPLAIGHVAGVPLSLSETFLMELEAMRSKLGRSSSWLITFPESRSERRSAESIEVTMLFRKVLTRLPKRLPDSYREENSVRADRWVQQILQEEFFLLHNNTHRGNGPYSIMRTYPSLIRSAGRLQAGFTDSR